MKKIFLKLFKWSYRFLLACFSLIIFYFLILSHPQELFAYRINYGRFAVYSDELITEPVLLSLDKVEKMLRDVEILDSAFAPTVFLCKNRMLYSIFTTLSGKTGISQGLNLSLFDYIFINKSYVEEINQYHNRRIKHSHLTGQLEQVISHEMMHNLMVNKMGWFETRKTPAWKLEGYAEYGSTISEIRKDSTDSLINRAHLLFEEDLLGVPEHSKFYYKSQLMIEYLSEVKKYNFEQVFDKFLTEKEVFREFWQWYLLSQDDF